MLKERMGGTEGAVAKREEAWRMVPSPPKVAVTSTFWGRREGRDTSFGAVVSSLGVV